MHQIFGISDPLHRLVISLIVSALSAVFQKEKMTLQNVHWLQPNNDLPETDPRFKLRW